MTSLTPSPISDQAAGEHIDIVFDQVAVDGAPPEYSFIEVENSQRASIKFGEWVHRDDGCWVLRISTAPTTGSAPVAWECYNPTAEHADDQVFVSRSSEDAERFDSRPLFYAAPPANAPVASVLTDEQIVFYGRSFPALLEVLSRNEGRVALTQCLRALLAASTGGDRT